MYVYDVNETPIKIGFNHRKPVFDCDLILSNLIQRCYGNNALPTFKFSSRYYLQIYKQIHNLVPHSLKCS